MQNRAGRLKTASTIFGKRSAKLKPLRVTSPPAGRDSRRQKHVAQRLRRRDQLLEGAQLSQRRGRIDGRAALGYHVHQRLGIAGCDYGDHLVFGLLPLQISDEIVDQAGFRAGIQPRANALRRQIQRQIRRV